MTSQASEGSLLTSKIVVEHSETLSSSFSLPLEFEVVELEVSIPFGERLLFSKFEGDSGVFDLFRSWVGVGSAGEAEVDEGGKET